MKKFKTALTLTLAAAITTVGGIGVKAGLAYAVESQENEVLSETAEFSETLGEADEETDLFVSLGSLPEFVEKPDYGIDDENGVPGAADMTMEEAGTAAAQELMRIYGIDLTGLTMEMYFQKALSGDIYQNRSIWGGSIETDNMTSYIVELDAVTGEICSAGKYLGTESSDAAFEEMEVIDEMYMKDDIGTIEDLQNYLSLDEPIDTSEMKVMYQVPQLMERYKDSELERAALHAIEEFNLAKGQNVNHFGAYYWGQVQNRLTISFGGVLDDNATIWLCIDYDTKELLSYDYYSAGSQNVNSDGLIIQ